MKICSFSLSSMMKTHQHPKYDWHDSSNGCVMLHQDITLDNLTICSFVCLCVNYGAIHFLYTGWLLRVMDCIYTGRVMQSGVLHARWGIQFFEKQWLSTGKGKHLDLLLLLLLVCVIHSLCLWHTSVQFTNTAAPPWLVKRQFTVRDSELSL